MTTVITGDIINSRKGDTENWIFALKNTLNQYGSTPEDWEIYRGDSFQLTLAPDKAMYAALHIKATIKQIKLYDVRMAIGIGEESYNATKIKESNGSAYVNSGECFDNLKKHTLAIKSEHVIFNETINTMLNLALLTANNWTSKVSEVIKVILENPDKNQNSLALLLNKSQSSISEALKRGGFEEIMKMNDYFKNNVSSL